MKRKGRKSSLIFILTILIFSCLSGFGTNVFAMDGEYHSPYGDDDLYTVKQQNVLLEIQKLVKM